MLCVEDRSKNQKSKLTLRFDGMWGTTQKRALEGALLTTQSFLRLGGRLHNCGEVASHNRLGK